MTSHALLEDLGFGEAAVAPAFPDQDGLGAAGLAVDGKDAAGARHQRDFAQFGTEGGQQFLGEPGCTQEPLALRAVIDGDAGQGAHRMKLRRR
jgi:hypothetical protein